MAVYGKYGRSGRYRTYRPAGYGQPAPPARTYGYVPGESPQIRALPPRPGGPWVRVGGRQAPATSGAPTGAGGTGGAYSQYAGVAGFNPAALPAGSYSPEHDILSRESQTGLKYKESDIETGEGRGETDYWTALAKLQEGQRNETADYGRAKEALGRSYKQLAGRQEEQQAGAGVMEGGAALQAAQKRAANQGREQGESDIRHQRAQKDYTDRISGLTTAHEREVQDYEKELKRGSESDLSYRQGQYELGAAEAAQRGYSPAKPAARPVPPKGRSLVKARKRARR